MNTVLTVAAAAAQRLKRSHHLHVFEKFCSHSTLHCQLDKLEKLTPLEAKLKQIELLSQSIADGFVYFKKREREMRQTNGK